MVKYGFFVEFLASAGQFKKIRVGFIVIHNYVLCILWLTRATLVCSEPKVYLLKSR